MSSAFTPTSSALGPRRSRFALRPGSSDATRLPVYWSPKATSPTWRSTMSVVPDRWRIKTAARGRAGARFVLQRGDAPGLWGTEGGEPPFAFRGYGPRENGLARLPDRI